MACRLLDFRIARQVRHASCTRSSPTMPSPRRPRLHIDTDEARASAPSSSSAFYRAAQDKYSHFHTSVFRYVTDRNVHWRAVLIYSLVGRTSWRYRYIARRCGQATRTRMSLRRPFRCSEIMTRWKAPSFSNRSWQTRQGDW